MINPAYPYEQPEKRQISNSMTASGHANGRHNDKDQLNTVEPGAAVKVGKESKEKLTDHRAEQGKEIDKQAGPLLVWKVDKRDGGQDDIGREEVVATEWVNTNSVL